MIPPKHLDVLLQVQERLSDSDITWVLTGSLGLALQGVETAVHDVDIQTDVAGAYEIERLFADCAVRPVTLVEDELVRSHLGALEIDGIEVEIIGDMQKRAPGGPWDPPPDLARLAIILDSRGTHAPVLPLEYERDAYRRMGRSEKAELIDEASHS